MIAGYSLPSRLVTAFIASVIFSMFVIDVVGAGAQARLTYSLAHDNILPLAGFPRKAPQPDPDRGPWSRTASSAGSPNDMTP